MGVLAGSLVAGLGDFAVKRVAVPEALFSGLALPAAESSATESRPTPPSTVDASTPIPVPTGATETDAPPTEQGPAESGGNGRGNNGGGNNGGGNSGGGNSGGGNSENKGNGKPKDDKN